MGGLDGFSPAKFQDASKVYGPLAHWSSDVTIPEDIYRAEKGGERPSEEDMQTIKDGMEIFYAVRAEMLRAKANERVAEQQRARNIPDEPNVGIPTTLAELQRKIKDATGDDRWNMICLVVEIGRELGVSKFRPYCWTLCGIDEKEFGKAENRLAEGRQKKFKDQYEAFKKTPVAETIERIAKKELNRIISSLRALENR